MADPKSLVEHIYTADPSARAFNNRLFVYPSHDLDNNNETNSSGDHFDMVDYHVLSMDTVGGEVVDHGVALTVDDVPWAARQMWAPDAAEKDGKFYLYFPAKDYEDIFRIGVATSDTPEGPFIPEHQPIPGSYSIDPAVFVDDDGQAYLYFGGVWGGQLQCWRTGRFVREDYAPREALGDEPAMMPRVAKLRSDMKSIDGEVKELAILDRNGRPLHASDHDRRFFEASWVHKYRGKYYFSYSTGDTHNIVYGTSNSPLGPFTYEGKISGPVHGWTTHHSIVQFQGKWYFFYHDTLMSGKHHLRNVKVRELTHDANGQIHLL